MDDLNRIVVGKHVHLHPEIIPSQTAQSVKRLLPPRLVSILYGRADIFDRVLQELVKGEPVVLYGMAGMGKSALASVAAWSLLEDYPNGVLWIDCGYNPLDIICDSVGQQFEDDQMPRLTAILKPARVRYLLGAYRVLVVLDDVWSADVARAFAQKCVPAGYSLIVTSRERIGRLGTLIEVSSLEYDAGVELFRDISGIKGQKEQANIVKLVDLLGGHPQGLTIAGALCLEEELSVHELINMLGPAEERVKKLRLGEDTSNNVWATFELSYQRLKPEEQIAFRTIGGSWAKGGTTELLSFLVLADEETMDAALRGLVKRSLARAEELVDGRRRYVVHDLIHAFAQGLIKETRQPIEQVYDDWLVLQRDFDN
jgi:hypothetical protein